ncbi:MAG: hypothetical protein U1G07_09835 [Verrucomicrobiota bacterium]
MALHPPAGNLKKRLTVNGSGCTNLHVFGGGAIDGAYPTGALTASVLRAMGPRLKAAPKTSGRPGIVSWPASGWTLQSNSRLATGSWSNYEGSILSNSVISPIVQGDLFFRLRHP